MSFKSRIKHNTKVIVQLRQRIHETFARRSDNEQSWVRWQNACAEFHKRYDDLAFFGGSTNIRQRLRSGDKDAINYAIDFLEVRPYFFRSGYMYKDFMRILQRCLLSATQRKRYEQIKARYEQYLQQRTVDET
ncbi:MAG: hypothetical protein ACPG8W_15830 [Candidatus Promineifilaceae bacterium]